MNGNIALIYDKVKRLIVGITPSLYIFAKFCAKKRGLERQPSKNRNELFRFNGDAGTAVGVQPLRLRFRIVRDQIEALGSRG